MNASGECEERGERKGTNKKERGNEPDYRCFLGAGRHLFLHGKPVGAAAGYAGAAYRRAARSGAGDTAGTAVSYQRLRALARPHTLRLDSAAGRRQFFQSLDGDQDTLCASASPHRAALKGSDGEGRAGRMAEAFLGARDPRRGRLRSTRRLRALESMRHGLVQRLVDWPYSTFHRYLNGAFIHQIGPACWSLT